MAEHLADITSGAPIFGVLGSSGPVEVTDHKVHSKGIREMSVVGVESLQCWFDLPFNNADTGLPIILLVQKLTCIQQLVVGQFSLQHLTDVVWLGCQILITTHQGFHNPLVICWSLVLHNLIIVEGDILGWFYHCCRNEWTWVIFCFRLCLVLSGHPAETICDAHETISVWLMSDHIIILP